jgi:DNA-binding beta-propeller fold protein YncE
MTVTTRIFEALSLGLMLSTGPMLWSTPTCAKGTGFVFVSSEKLNNVAAIDPKQDDRVIKWIETSRSPREMKFRNVRKQQLLVACGDDAAIDVGTLAVIDHVPPDANPEFFELSLDDKALYVSNKAESTVQVISMAEKLIEKEIPTGAGPEGIAVSGKGNVTPLGIAATKDSEIAFVSLGQANIVAIVTATRKIEHYVSMGGGAGGVAVSADEKNNANARSDDVSIVDVASHAVIKACWSVARRTRSRPMI